MSQDTGNMARRFVFLGSQSEPCIIQEVVSIPKLKSGEILGKMRMATICKSDLHTISGRRKKATPCILGHEGIIEVIDHLRSDASFQRGDRLTFHIADCCDECENCRGGLQQKCTSLLKYGHSTMTEDSQLNGCYASHIVIHCGTHVVKIPDHVQDKMAATANCALATMINAVSDVLEKRSPYDTVVVIQGCGLLGIYGCVLLHEAGFCKVFCVGTNPKRLEMVPKFGGIPIVEGTHTSNGLHNNSVDVIIEVCGDSSVIPVGMKLLRAGGLYVFAGMVHPDSKLDINGEQIIQKCITIKGIHNYGPQHLDEAVSFLSRTCDKYPYDELFSPSFKLTDFEQALEQSKQQVYFRVCVTP
ncbi:uncharacterized protein LOC111321670 isoform X2 [Stylophora pistillata]|uniref:uncharacterized protein LOC111321670 isoform X2 n=1 Tax=Stylophora pistillata TaxID=50429 RepID=UPI000C03AC7C|nr:uncharacterized protein LOC111321670 isoform X2 [Stylophora pistillata]